MPERTVKGRQFSIIINGQRITVTHVPCKGNRCRVKVPVGAYIEVGEFVDEDLRDELPATPNDLDGQCESGTDLDGAL